MTSIASFEGLKTGSKEFSNNSFSFLRYGPLKSSFLLIQKVPRKEGKCAFDTASHMQRGRDVKHDLLGSLYVRFVNDNELCKLCAR